MGYEGIASRNYFAILKSVIKEDFIFDNRNRRPSKDPINCMLNFGYSLLNKEIYGELENRGLNAFCGFLHRDGKVHATLASDLIEEWRAPIVDATVMSLIQGNEIKVNMFIYENNECRMNDEAIKIFLNKYEMKMYTTNKYLSYIDKPITFRKAIWHQANRLAKSIENACPELYSPVILR